MKTSVNLFWSLTIVVTSIFFSSCQKEVSDAEKLAALKNVAFSLTGISFDVNLPAAALNGQTFDELMNLDSSTYANPSNYSVDFVVNMLADNTKENASDAKFDGMLINMIMDTLTNVPFTTSASGFELLQNTTQQVMASGSINLGTHEDAVLYMFQQMVDGQDLATTLAPVLNYNIGSLSGGLNVPDLQAQIPTAASTEMKNFLSGLLSSSVFNGK